MLGFVREFRLVEWLLIASTCAACLLAVAKRRQSVLPSIQAWSLAAGLLLTHFNLGSAVGHKLDPRLVFALIAGAASLHCCYICLLAYVAMAWRLSGSVGGERTPG